MSEEGTTYSGMLGTPHPEVFDIRAMPPHKLPLKPGQLEESKIRHFFEKGYLIVPDFFKKEELDACRNDIEGLVDGLAQLLYDNGKIKDKYEKEDLFRRLTFIEREFPGAVILLMKQGRLSKVYLHKDKGLFERLAFLEKDYPGANILLHKQGTLTKSFANLWSNEQLLNVVEQIIGPEIMGHPVWNLRTKTPQNEATTVPWHQDSAYLDNKAYEVLQLTAWIPLLDANEKNGCMEVVSGGHLAGKVARHTCCWGNTWYVVLDDADMERDLNVNVKRDTVICPVPYGGMLLLNNMIPHHSLNNTSNEIRWSLDLRWQRPDKDVGFYGLKKGVMIRSEKNPLDKIDWDSFNNVDRHVEQNKDCEAEDLLEDKFDTTIVGPWMKKWEMTHVNRHTAQLSSRSEVSWHKA